jgi:hypothetical protein
VANDIVHTLRAISQFVGGAGPKLCKAADEIERLRAVLNAIDALHQPITDHDEGFMPITVCRCCVDSWPCRTHLWLHPNEARRG